MKTCKPLSQAIGSIILRTWYRSNVESHQPLNHRLQITPCPFTCAWSRFIRQKRENKSCFICILRICDGISSCAARRVCLRGSHPSLEPLSGPNPGSPLPQPPPTSYMNSCSSPLYLPPVRQSQVAPGGSTRSRRSPSRGGITMVVGSSFRGLRLRVAVARERRRSELTSSRHGFQAPSRGWRTRKGITSDMFFV